MTTDLDVLEPGLLETLASNEGLRAVIVHFEDTVPPGVTDGLSEADVLYTFENLPAVVVLADRQAIHSLANLEEVRYIEDGEKTIEFHLASAVLASRAREVWDPDFVPPEGVTTEPSPEIRDPDGNLIDGSGVGIAVVDSGIDATHPDLAGDGKVAGNFVVTPAGVQMAGPYTEHASTHGTKVAGIAAGTGAAKAAGAGGDAGPGAAPGASLYGFATWRPDARVVPSETVLLPAIAFDWILSHGDDQDPPIDVVLNAWSCTDPACNVGDELPTHLQLASQLAENGDVVVFSVGNEGGGGSASHVSPESRLSTRGILGVGAADDEEAGLRTDCTKSISSRGAAEDPTTWPDLIAPGDVVWSPQSIHPSQESRVPVPDNPTPQESRRVYTSITSTSASAAHIAGVAALVLQANPTLGPDAVEYVLKETADQLPHGSDGFCVDYVAADPMQPSDGSNFAAGHGLVDALDAVDLVTGTDKIDGLPEIGDPEPVPDSLIPIDPGVEPTQTFYLSGEEDLTRDRPPAQGVPLVRHIGPGDTITHTSPPLKESFEAEGAIAEIWMGSTGEFQAHLGTQQEHVVRVERLPAGGGEAELLLEDDFDYMHVNPINPIYRIEADLFSDTVQFEEDDRIRMTVHIQSVDTLAPASGQTLIYSDAHPFPARIQFGERVDRPAFGTDAWCTQTVVCARLGEDLQYVSVECDGELTEYHVEFTGPAGSTATVSCDRATTSCTVPGQPGSGEIGTCRAQTLDRHSYTGRGTCFYTTPDGTRAGDGHCSVGALPGS